VPDVLSNISLDRRTRKEGPTVWCTRSPDLNPVRTSENPLCMQLYLTARDISPMNFYACQNIPKYPGIFERMLRSMSRSASNLMEDILSIHYNCTLSAVTHKLGRAIAQAVSRRLPTAAVRVQTRVWSCGIL
jgi:hypothetical protein